MAKKIIKRICEDINVDYLSLKVSEISSEIIMVSKFNWDYIEALKFQEACVDYVFQQSKMTILIATNHPACLTVGRGLQKKVGDTTELIDFTDWQRSQVNIPVYDIKRGGGVTFHHPGQLVIYPIVNLTSKKMKVYTLMSHVLRELSSSIVEIYGDKDFDYCRDLLGLWCGHSKIASIGLQVRRFVSFHGVALNVFDNDEIKNALQVIYPCGLPGDTYQSLSELYQINLTQSDIEKLLNRFEKRATNLFRENKICTEI